LAPLRNARLRPATAILLGGLCMGTIDILDAFIFSALRSGASPARVLQGIAGGFYGRATFEGGPRTAIIGGLVHYTIAFSVVGACVLASRRIPFLVRRPLLAGALYGLCVLAFMNLVVLPLSAIGLPRWPWSVAVNQVAIHIVGVGMVSALFARATHPR